MEVVGLLVFGAMAVVNLAVLGMFVAGICRKTGRAAGTSGPSPRSLRLQVGEGR